MMTGSIGEEPFINSSPCYRVGDIAFLNRTAVLQKIVPRSHLIFMPSSNMEDDYFQGQR